MRLWLALVAAVEFGSIASHCRADPESRIPHPSVVFIVGLPSLPEVDARALPPQVRSTYASLAQVRDRLHETSQLPESASRRASLHRLRTEYADAWARLATALGRAGPAHFDAQTWMLFGEALRHVADHDFGTITEDAASTASSPDYTRAIAAYRQAAGSAPSDGLGAFARLFEAWCWLGMDRPANAAPALRIVAATGPRALRGEARYRLGDLAYDNGAFDVAVGWYRRALPDSDEHIRPYAAFKLVLALKEAGHRNEALSTIDRILPNEPPELAQYLDQLRTVMLEDEEDE